MNNPYSDEFDIKAERALKYYNDFVHRNVSGHTPNTICINVCSSLERFSPYDVVQVRLKSDMTQEIEFVELKGRDVSYFDFSDCEVNSGKIKELQKTALQSGKNCWLAALYYLDDIIVVWKIDPHKEYEETIKEALKYTAEPEEGTVMKNMIKFKYSDGYKYRYEFPQELKEQVKKEVEERKRRRREKWIAQNY